MRVLVSFFFFVSNRLANSFLSGPSGRSRFLEKFLSTHVALDREEKKTTLKTESIEASTPTIRSFHSDLGNGTSDEEKFGKSGHF